MHLAGRTVTSLLNEELKSAPGKTGGFSLFSSDDRVKRDFRNETNTGRLLRQKAD